MAPIVGVILCIKNLDKNLAHSETLGNSFLIHSLEGSDAQCLDHGLRHT